MAVKHVKKRIHKKIKKQKMEVKTEQPTLLWSNKVPDLDEEMRTPTPREQHLTDLAKKNNKEPQQYNITNKNPHAMHVVYNARGEAISIDPGQTKSMLLYPMGAHELMRFKDLEISE